MLAFLETRYLVLHFSYHKSVTFQDDDICNIVIYADNTTFYWKCNQEFDL